MTIKIITVGTKSQNEYADIISEYVKRLPRTITVDWAYIKHASGDAISSKQQESENILRLIPNNHMTILLDERGKQLSSPALSTKIFSANKDVVFIIGGAYGVNKAVHDESDFIWSLSYLVFPHQLIRVILSEQIYRAYTISIHHPYHHS